MSEPEQETPETETPAPDTEEEEAAEEEEQPEEPGQSLAAAAAAEGSSDIPKKIERAVSDQRKRLGKILGVDLSGSECPTCGGMGYTVGGADPDAEMVHPENLVACEKCNGWGQVITGARNPDHVTAMCIACSGNGFITKPEQTNVTPLPQPIGTVTAGPTMGQMMPDGTFVPFGVNASQTT